MRRWIPTLTAFALALALAGCGQGASDSDSGTAGTASPTSPPASSSASPIGSPSSEPSGTDTGSSTAPASESASPEPEKSPEAILKDTAKDVVDSLRDRDLDRLADAVHPENGVRFSPYPHIDSKQDVVFHAGGLPDFKDKEVRVWGTADGSGEPIKLTFRDYFEKFVYDADFAEAPDMSVNKLLGTGNMQSNIKEVYPNASYVEFHVPGSKKNDGMDWKSLVLVFEPVGDDWKLVGIVHGQWTI